VAAVLTVMFSIQAIVVENNINKHCQLSIYKSQCNDKGCEQKWLENHETKSVGY
jgi:hypothetical protein